MSYFKINPLVPSTRNETSLQLKTVGLFKYASQFNVNQALKD